MGFHFHCKPDGVPQSRILRKFAAPERIQVLTMSLWMVMHYPDALYWCYIETYFAIDLQAHTQFTHLFLSVVECNSVSQLLIQQLSKD